MHRTLPSAGAVSQSPLLAPSPALVAVASVVLAALALLRVGGWRDDPRGWGKYAGSIRALTANVVATPCDLRSVLALARELRDAGDLSRASSELEIAASLCTLTPVLYELAFDLHIQQQQRAATLRDLRRLRMYAAFSSRNAYDLALLAAAAGQPQYASPVYVQMILSDPLFPHAIDHLASIFMRAGDLDSLRKLRRLEIVLKCRYLDEGVTRQQYCRELSKYPAAASVLEAPLQDWHIDLALRLEAD